MLCARIKGRHVPHLAKPPRPPRDAWRTLSVALVAFVTIFGLEVMFKAIDPFGLHHASVRHSNEMSARTLAPFYPSTGQDHIVVVLIDEGTLRARGLAWPPPHAYYAEMLRRILRGQPRAVYVDLLTVDRRGSAQAMDAARADIGAEIAASGVPVMFAQLSPAKPGVLAGVPGLGFATAGWKRAGDAYPVSIAPGQLVDAPEGMDAACDPATAQPSVALALYDVACRVPAAGGALPAGCGEPASTLADRCAPLWMVWGMRAPPLLGEASRMQDCDPGRAKGGWPALVDMVWRDLWSGFSPEAFEQGRVRCPFTITIPEQNLDRDTVGLLRDRVVLVGANLSGLDDSVLSPVHSRLPGVYLHAMALDNLMTYGHAHPRPALDGPWLDLLIALIAAWLLALVLRAGRSAFCTWLLLACVGVLVSAGPSWVLWHFFHIAPPNWLAMLFMILLVVGEARHKMHREEAWRSHRAKAPPLAGSVE